MISTSVSTSRPSSTIRDASAIAARVAATVSSIVVGVTLDEQRVVYGSADLNSALGGQAARQPQHLSTVGLHRKVPQRR